MKKSTSRSPWFVQVLFILCFLAVGVGFAWIGWTAITDRHFEVEWRARGPTLGPSHGTSIFNGAEAVRMGLGVLSAGAMGVIWALALALQLFRRKLSHRMHDLVAKGLGWISFGLLATALGCFFPVWQLRSLPFFATLLVIGGVVLLATRSKEQRRAGKLFPVLIVAAFVAFLFDTSLAAGIIIAIFAALAILGHLLVLFPQIEKRLLAADKASAQDRH